jgi:hypothetical protein
LEDVDSRSSCFGVYAGFEKAGEAGKHTDHKSDHAAPVPSVPVPVNAILGVEIGNLPHLLTDDPIVGNKNERGNGDIDYCG